MCPPSREDGVGGGREEEKEEEEEEENVVGGQSEAEIQFLSPAASAPLPPPLSSANLVV